MATELVKPPTATPLVAVLLSECLSAGRVSESAAHLLSSWCPSATFIGVSVVVAFDTLVSTGNLLCAADNLSLSLLPIPDSRLGACAASGKPSVSLQPSLWEDSASGDVGPDSPQLCIPIGVSPRCSRLPGIPRSHGCLCVTFQAPAARDVFLPASELAVMLAETLPAHAAPLVNIVRRLLWRRPTQPSGKPLVVDTELDTDAAACRRISGNRSNLPPEPEHDVAIVTHAGFVRRRSSGSHISAVLNSRTSSQQTAERASPSVPQRGGSVNATAVPQQLVLAAQQPCVSAASQATGTAAPTSSAGTDPADQLLHAPELQRQHAVLGCGAVGTVSAPLSKSQTAAAPAAQQCSNVGQLSEIQLHQPYADMACSSDSAEHVSSGTMAIDGGSCSSGGSQSARRLPEHAYASCHNTPLLSPRKQAASSSGDHCRNSSPRGSLVPHAHLQLGGAAAFSHAAKGGSSFDGGRLTGPQRASRLWLTFSDWQLEQRFQPWHAAAAQQHNLAALELMAPVLLLMGCCRPFYAFLRGPGIWQWAAQLLLALCFAALRLAFSADSRGRWRCHRPQLLVIAWMGATLHCIRFLWMLAAADRPLRLPLLASPIALFRHSGVETLAACAVASQARWPMYILLVAGHCMLAARYLVAVSAELQLLSAFTAGQAHTAATAAHILLLGIGSALLMRRAQVNLRQSFLRQLSSIE